MRALKFITGHVIRYNEIYQMKNPHVDLEMLIKLGKKSKFHEKKAQKVDFRNFLDPFWGFALKQSSEFMIPTFHDSSLEPKITKCGDLL